MKCDRVIPGTQRIVDSVWEVRLCNDDWEKVKRAAMSYDTTYSWVVRWCIFSALRRENIERFAAAVTEFRNSGKVGASQSGSHHRMQLCLYGTDETLLKNVAIRFSTTITVLIRVAIRLFMHIFYESVVSSFSFLENGIRITQKCSKVLKYSFSAIAAVSSEFEQANLTGYNQMMNRLRIQLGTSDLIEYSYY